MQTGIIQIHSSGSGWSGICSLSAWRFSSTFHVEFLVAFIQLFLMWNSSNSLYQLKRYEHYIIIWEELRKKDSSSTLFVVLGLFKNL